MTAAPTAPVEPIAHPTAKCCWCDGALIRVGEIYWCSTKDCRTRQRTYAMGVEITKGKTKEWQWLYVPTPKQVAMESPKRPRPSDGSAFNVLGGGQAGPGKSHGARWSMWRKALALPGYSGLILRNLNTELERTHIPAFERETAIMKKHGIQVEFLPSASRLKFGNGSLVEFGHMADPTRYLGAEYDDIVADEASTMAPGDDTGPGLFDVAARARSTKQIILDAGGPWFRPVTNPGGPSSLMLRQLFIEHAPDFEQLPRLKKSYDPAMWVFVEARLEDNPYLGPGYEDTLAMLNDTRYRQLREGDWYAFAGKFFTQWRESLHARDITIAPGSVQWVRSIDWGRSAPGCVCWFACLPDSHYHCAAELKFIDMDVDQVADEIRRIDHELGATQIRATIADPALFNKGQETGESIAETFLRNRIILTRGDNNRIQGWARLREFLRPAPDGVPWLTIAPRCAYLKRTLPALMQDKNNPEDVDTRQDDHGADAVRYFVRSRPAPTRYARPELPKDSVGAMAQSLRDALPMRTAHV